MLRDRASSFIYAAPRRPTIPRSVLTLAALLLFSACSFPRIIVLHDPLSSDEHVRLGGIYASQGETAHARDQYRLAVEADKKNGKAWQLLGDVSYQLKEYKEAEKAYGEALDLDPANGDLQNNLAWVYVQENKRLGKAKELVEKAMQSTPQHRPYYLDTLGVVLLKLGKPQDAIAALKESVATLPKDQPAMQAEAWLHLSEAYRAAGNEAAAEDALKRSKDLSPTP
jgi:Tfp pilus assembly protein PilF